MNRFYCVLLLCIGAVIQVGLWSTTGDGSAPVWVQAPVNVLLGLAYVGGALLTVQH